MTTQRKTQTTTEPAGNPKAPDGAANSAVKGREIAKRLPAIGYVTWLCSQSRGHKQLFVQDMEWRLFPPIILGQYKLCIETRTGGLPTAYASWAFLSEEVETSYRTSQKLRPGDWRSGDRLWLVDVVAPFGGAVALLDELCFEIHLEREVRLLYPGADGTPIEKTLSELIRGESRHGNIASSRTETDATQN